VKKGEAPDGLSLEKIKINKIMLNKVPIMMSQRFDFMAWCRES